MSPTIILTNDIKTGLRVEQLFHLEDALVSPLCGFVALDRLLERVDEALVE